MNETDLAELGCGHCVPVVDWGHNPGLFGRSVLTVTVEHANTCPRFNRCSPDGRPVVIAKPNGIIIHFRRATAEINDSVVVAD